eukprot:scaffold97779_cov31-Attheya_sp.AAC.1
MTERGRHPREKYTYSNLTALAGKKSRYSQSNLGDGERDPRQDGLGYAKGTPTAMATPEAITFLEGLASTTTHPTKRQQHDPTTCGAATKKTTHPTKCQQHAPT